MDTELVRFRINPELRDKAAKVCAELGLELADVLRSFVTRVDFDQYAGQYEAILAAQTNFFDGDSNYFARYKIELARDLGIAGEDGLAGLSDASRKALREAETIFGGERHLALAGVTGRGHPWPVPFDAEAVLSRRGRTRLVIGVNFLQQGASVEIEDFLLEPIA